MDFGEQEEFIIVRVNGGKLKNSDELTIELNE